MISFQTNYAALVGEQNMNTNQIFQTKTIESLTSGYRINSSGDDAAGLAVANGYRNEVAELTQGVINAHSAVSQLQIMDGGLNNISMILDRLQTLATESASSTFTGNRATLNNEYQSLLKEIDRQAANMGLDTGGTNATLLNVYIGGGNSQLNSQVSVNLTNKSVDTTGLNLTGTNLLGAGTDISNPVNLNTVSSGMVLAGSQTGDSQVMTFNLAGGQQITATIQSTSSGGITVADAINQLNNSLSAYGINASVDTTTGSLQLSSASAFTMSAAATTNGGTGVATVASTVDNNTAMYSVAGATYTDLTNSATDAITFSSGGTSTTVTLDASNGGNVANAVQTLNNQLASLGIKVTLNATGDGVEFQSSSAFSYSQSSASTAGVFAASGQISNTNASGPTAVGTSTGNALAAVLAVQNAVTALGTVQGIVGAGENTLNYAIDLANSQNTNIQSAESQLRDADVATEAANLTKAQVLQQASVAAMAQANSAPQTILKLLQG